MTMVMTSPAPARAAGAAAERPLVKLEGYSLRRGGRLVLDDVRFSLPRGGAIALVGESGAGKSTIAMALIGLLDGPEVRAGGVIAFDDVNENLARAKEKTWAKLRGRRISMIFQDAGAALNPCYTVGRQLMTPLRRLNGLSKAAARERAVELLGSVGINDPEGRLDAFPHQLSGGMQQRVMIAIALACDPELLLADEPTSALDVTIQAQIVRLILEQTRRRGAACVFVLHDLALASQACDSIVVLYAGQVMETGSCETVLRRPLHPYTKALRSCVLEIDGAAELVPPPGGPPPLDAMPQGCRFCARCPRALPECAVRKPPLREAAGRKVACWNLEEDA